MQNKFMEIAINIAHDAVSEDEVPVGAVIVKDGVVISSAHNRTISENDPTAHAEILALREACKKLGTNRLDGCDLYVTLEPCPMCAQAISHARIKSLYFGAYDLKGGGVDNGPRIFSHNTAFHKPEVYGGIQEEECSTILKDFFQGKR